MTAACSEARTCPSSSIDHATHLVAVRRDDGQFAYISPALPLTDAAKADLAGGEVDPHHVLRLAGPCVEGACAQWTGTGCGVIERVLDVATDDGAVAKLRSCGIRRSCRWFSQRGPAACHVCPFVPTDNRAEPALST